MSLISNCKDMNIISIIMYFSLFLTQKVFNTLLKRYAWRLLLSRKGSSTWSTPIPMSMGS